MGDVLKSEQSTQKGATQHADYKKQYINNGGDLMLKLEFEMVEAQRFLDVLEEGGKFLFQTFGESKKEYNLINQFHGTLGEHAEELQRLTG